MLCGHIHEARGTDRIGGTRPGPVAEGHYARVVVRTEIVVDPDGEKLDLDETAAG